MTKKDFKCIEGLYYVEELLEVGCNPWVDEEQLELILLEINNGVK